MAKPKSQGWVELQGRGWKREEGARDMWVVLKDNYEEGEKKTRKQSKARGYPQG